MVIINKLAMKAKRSGVIILGGGVVKHHILNANIWFHKYSIIKGEMELIMLFT